MAKAWFPRDGFRKVQFGDEGFGIICFSFLILQVDTQSCWDDWVNSGSGSRSVESLEGYVWYIYPRPDWKYRWLEPVDIGKALQYHRGSNVCRNDWTMQYAPLDQELTERKGVSVCEVEWLARMGQSGEFYNFILSHLSNHHLPRLSALRKSPTPPDKALILASYELPTAYMYAHAFVCGSAPHMLSSISRRILPDHQLNSRSPTSRCLRGRFTISKNPEDKLPSISFPLLLCLLSTVIL